MKKDPPTLRYKTSQLAKLPIGELLPGMYVAELDRPWEETPFLFQGFRIENFHDIEVLSKYCTTVTVDTQRSVELQPQDKRRTPGRGGARTTVIRRRTVPVERELSRARRAHAASSRLVRNITDDIRLGKAIDTPAAKEVVNDCVDSIIANEDAIGLLTRIREKDEYTSQHSLSVSALTIALGNQLGMDRAALVDVGLCGLLHDVGKLLTPDHVLKKPKRLTQEEMLLMQQHTTLGRDILMSSGGDAMKALDVAHAHHERCDGSGYPRGLVASQLTPYTRMVAIADTFDAITSNRVYDNARTNAEAFRILNEGRKHRWDSRLVIRFIESIGIYPAGTVVELNNGVLGVVIESHPTLKLQPRIVLTHGPSGRLHSPAIIDLAEAEHAGRLRIVRLLPPSAAGPNLRELIDSGILDNLDQLPAYQRSTVS